MSTIIIDKIKQEIQNLAPNAQPEEVGVVTAVGDGIAEINGLKNALMMVMVVFDAGYGKSLEGVISAKVVLYGVMLSLEEDADKVVV